ncbi:GntR family transcriptional regulator [Vagococcus xieshaowenii]|uniref:GntR family transcriptional regulator n=1 Tax=Vagococcus xieshaowenii TaxID=2562451 RepID=A0AAJ5JM47_9ENTE|nr:GntR family transcriptional regulator [Vagococcus xieshaowenii]QCA28662.1 GntR family transcriptional regulator [Vagococcus xieshaowenii]TFZ40531.1 GntR family transcriptional regulator [Vagococcus xieshaowenii]
MTKYEYIADVIRKRILSGEYPENTLIPNQIELVEEFNVSRMTIKKAINILMMEGLVYSQRGLGTTVLNNQLPERSATLATDYSGLTKGLEGKEIQSNVIKFDVTFPNELTQEKLKISSHHPVYEIIRLRIVDEEPYALEHTLMPVDLVPGLTKEIASHSIYSYLEQIGIEFAGAHRNIHADKSNELDHQYLECAITDPVLEVEQVVYLKNSRPIEFSRSRNRYDKKSYTVLDVM